MTDSLVPNPRRMWLANLLADLEHQADEVRRAYQKVHEAMRSEKVWTGPTADRWTTEVDDQQQRLTQLARNLVDAVRDELHRQPPMVTRSQAQHARWELNGLR